MLDSTLAPRLARLSVCLSASLLLLACAGVKRGGASVTHRAGLKTKLWYETRMEAATRIAKEKGAPDDVELEAKLLPAGGLILLEKDDLEPGGLAMGTPRNNAGIPVTEKPNTTPEMIQVLVDGQVVHTCDALEQSDQEGTQDHLGRHKKYEYCGVRPALPQEFDLVLLNYRNEPIGKYHVVQKAAPAP